MQKVMTTKMAIPNYEVALLDKAATAFTSLGPQKAMSQMLNTPKSSFKPIEVGADQDFLTPVHRFGDETLRDRTRGEWWSGYA